MNRGSGKTENANSILPVRRETGCQDAKGAGNMKNSDFPCVVPADLQVGMYVMLPLSWHEHPFLTNHFLIESEKDIQKIRELGLKIGRASCRVRV